MIFLHPEGWLVDWLELVGCVGCVDCVGELVGWLGLVD